MQELQFQRSSISRNCTPSAAILSGKQKNDTSLQIDGKELQEMQFGELSPLDFQFLQFNLHGISGGIAGNAIQVQFQGELQFSSGLKNNGRSLWIDGNCLQFFFHPIGFENWIMPGVFVSFFA